MPNPSAPSNTKLALVALETVAATSVAFFFGIGGVIALAVAAAFGAWAMQSLTGSTVGSSSGSMTLSTRKQKLAEAEQKFGTMFPTVRNISVGEAQQLMQEQPARYVLVDVRNPEEQQVGWCAIARPICCCVEP